MTAQSNFEDDDFETFAFWKLPVLTRSLVTKFMDPEDLISLSMHSTLFKRLLMAHKIKCATLDFDSAITIRRRYDKTRGFKITLEFIGADHPINFVSPIDVRKEYAEKEERLINNKWMTVASEYSNKFVFGDDIPLRGVFPAAVRVIRHLLEILRVENIRMDIQFIPARALFKRFIWDLVGKIDYFRFDDMEGDCISHKQTKFLMNSTKIDKLRLDVNVDDPEELSGIRIRNKQFFARTGNWITMDNVIEATSEVIHVDIEEVEPNKTIELVEKWRNGEKLVNLKNLKIITKTKQSPAIEKIKKFNGVQEHPENASVWEIRRTTDGRIAHFFAAHYNTITLDVVQMD